MTVAELIKLLADMPREAVVIIDKAGYLDKQLYSVTPVIVEIEEDGYEAKVTKEINSFESNSEANGVLLD